MQSQLTTIQLTWLAVEHKPITKNGVALDLHLRQFHGWVVFPGATSLSSFHIRFDNVTLLATELSLIHDYSKNIVGFFVQIKTSLLLATSKIKFGEKRNSPNGFLNIIV